MREVREREERFLFSIFATFLTIPKTTNNFRCMNHFTLNPSTNVCELIQEEVEEEEETENTEDAKNCECNGHSTECDDDGCKVGESRRERERERERERKREREREHNLQ